MVKGVKVELSIRDNTTGQYLRIPVVPEAIPYTDGEGQDDTVKILNLGDVDFPNGVALDSMDWASFFPARYDASYCATSDLKTPIQYRDQFSSWKDAGTDLQVICPAAGINKSMRLRSFSWELRGFEGDIYYSVGFKEKKTIRPQKIAVQVNGTTGAVTAAAQTPAGRPPVPSKTTPKTYTVVSGDTLTRIAKKLGLASWNDLYTKNKATIGPDPGKIYPGQVLNV